MNEDPTHLDPIPDHGEEGGRVDERNSAQRLGIVCRRKLDAVRKMVPQVPNSPYTDIFEIEDGYDAGDRCLRRVW